MSSFFRNPNDVTESEDQTYEDDDEVSSSCDEESTSNARDGSFPKLTSKPSNALRKISTLDSTTSSTNVGALSRQLTVEDSAKQETKDSLMLVLLEDKCLNDALAAFEASNTSGKPYTKEDPQVRALADDKFKYMLDMLGRANILPSGPEGRDSASRAIKQQARDGLEYLSTTSPQPGRPGVLHRDSSLQSLQSGIHDLILAQSTTRAVNAIPLYHQAALTHNMDAVRSLPPILQHLVDHPMFSLSRYLRDFIEVRMVGRGGYGKVYHVQHRLDGSNYAVKKINLNAQRLRRIQERGQKELDGLLNELRSLARFDHPNIVRYYGGWLEHSAHTPFPSPAPNGNLLIEAPPDSSSDDAQAGADASEEPFVFAESRKSSVDILFEHSGVAGEILGDLDEMDEQDDLVAELQPQIRTVRKRAGSESTTASGRSKLSSVHAVGPEDAEEDEAMVRVSDSVSLSETGLSTSSDVPPLHEGPPRTGASYDRAESVLTLHIQMALHPLSLADYLTSTLSPSSSTSSRHCFHLLPSLHILLSILDGVQYLHSCGVVHRDLKPSNVFLTLHKGRTPACVDLSHCSDCAGSPDGRERRKGFLNARIGDFGLVTEIARASASPSSTSSEAMPATPAKAVGTELYRPPQPFSSTSTHSLEHLDVYALGIILVELLVPFGTKMERQRVLVEVREGKWEDTGLVVRFGGVGRKVWSLIRDMIGGGLGCEDVRTRIEQILRAMDE
jgi:translation initiation factor 2-alpha kinase 3